jgi:hypothetical protein
MSNSCALIYQHVHELLMNHIINRRSCALNYQHELLSKQSNINTSSCASKYQHEHELLRKQMSTQQQISTRCPVQSNINTRSCTSNQISAGAPEQAINYQRERLRKQSTRAPEIKCQDEVLRNRVIIRSSCAMKNEEEERLLQTRSTREQPAPHTSATQGVHLWQLR